MQIIHATPILRAGRPVRIAAFLVLVSSASLAGAQPAPAVASAAFAVPTQARYDAARDQYEIGHFQVAFAAFAQLADEGHCEAARIAHQMVRFGRELYASEFTVAPVRLAQWRAHGHCPATLAAR